MGTRILLCDRQPLIRSGLRMILDQQADLRVLAEADEREVVALTSRMRPDLVLMDLDLPLRRGLEIITELARCPQRPAVPVLVLTAVDDEGAVFAALRAGARGFLLMGCPPEELFTAIRAIVGGGGAIASAVAGRMLDRVAPYLPASGDDHAQHELLTPRERCVLRLVALGRSNRAIAHSLGISEATVRSHVHHVLTKLGLEDRTQAVVYAYRSGFVSPLLGDDGPGSDGDGRASVGLPVPRRR